MVPSDPSTQETSKPADMSSVERRIARRYVTDTVIEIWIPRKGVLGRAKSAELPVADMSMFGASVYAAKGDKIAKGQVVQVTIGDERATAIVRSERPSQERATLCRYGLEFIKPSDSFLNEVRLITETARRLSGEEIGQEQLWLRSS